MSGSSRSRAPQDQNGRELGPRALQTRQRLLDATAKTDLTLFHLDDITPHYATTISKWREAFFDHADEIRAMGFDDAFLRMWDFYFAYCEGGFLERAIGNVQLTFTMPDCRREPIL